jgi:hypothetical protein
MNTSADCRSALSSDIASLKPHRVRAQQRYSEKHNHCELDAENTQLSIAKFVVWCCAKIYSYCVMTVVRTGEYQTGRASQD